MVGLTVDAAPRAKNSRGHMIAGVMVGGALAALAMCVTTAAVFGDLAPDLVLALWPNDAQATLRKAATSIKDETPPPAAIALAREAVARDATKPKAFALIAMDPRASNAAKDRALAYSRILSRRDQATTFLLMQKSLERNDIEGFFGNFDTAIRTSEQAAERYSPLIVRAMANDRVVDGLAKLLAKRPPWGRAFLLAAINGAPTAKKAARLVNAMMRSGVEVDSDYAGVLVNRLLAEGEFADAWNLYRETFPGRAKSPLRPVVRSLETTTGFDWLLMNDSDLWAQVEGAGAGTSVRYFANAGAGGVVAKQFIVVPPGTYTMSFKASTQAGSAFQSSWVAACRGTQVLARADARRSGRLIFNVPAQCPVVEFRLTANADLNVSENEGLIEAIRLAKTGS